MYTNLEYRAGERQRRQRQASEAQREKGQQRSRARDKIQMRHFFVGRTAGKFCSGGDKMGNATGHQCKVKMSGSEKKSERELVRHFLPKSLTRKFLEVSRCSRAKQRQRNVQKKFAARAKLLFLLIRPIVVFHRSPALPPFEQSINTIESFALSPG